MRYANDLLSQTFLQDFRPDINPATTFTLETVDNGPNPQGTADAGYVVFFLTSVIAWLILQLSVLRLIWTLNTPSALLLVFP